MKRLIVVLSLAFCAFICFAQSVPSFDAENAFVFDAFELRGNKSGKLRLTNNSFDEQVSLSVFYFNAESASWESLGDASFSKIGGTESVSAPVAQYFALVPKNGKSYEYQIKKQADYFDDLVHLYVSFSFNTPMPEAPEENAFVFDNFAIKGKAKDNIRFINSSYDDNISFFVFYFDEYNSAWELYGVAMLKSFGDTCFIDRPPASEKRLRLNNIRYFAVVSRNKKSYEYQMKKTSDDLYIYVLSSNLSTRRGTFALTCAVQFLKL